MGRLKHPNDARVVVTCEHASNRVPRAYGRLGLRASDLASHIAWDPGASELAGAIARELGCPLHRGSWSRLVIDLNRSLGHRGLVARSSFGKPIPGNRDVDTDERAHRVRRYWEPYREAVKESVRRRIAGSGSCVHLSVHSFTPLVNGDVRTADVAVLYDPSRRTERDFATDWAGRLRAAGMRARRNYPYRGTSDGLVTAFRAEFPASRYLGFELEVNQGLVPDRNKFLHMLGVTLSTFLGSLRSDTSSRRRRR